MARSTSYQRGVQDGFNVQVGDARTYDATGDQDYRRGLSVGRGKAIDEELIEVYLRENGGDREITTGEAAHVLGCSVPTLIDRIDKGHLAATKGAGGNRKLLLSDVLRYSSDFQRRAA